MSRFCLMMVDRVCQFGGDNWHRWRCGLLGILSVSLLILPLKQSYGWEADTHYGLIKWLAVKAGFSLEYAEIIAAGSESADESGVLEATPIVSTNICILRSEEASRHVQHHHFPSGGYVPSKPPKRFVTPGAPDIPRFGNRWVRQEIGTPGGKGASPKTRLERFGASLHPLADSWAHRGEPSDLPFPCPSDLVWAHPETRGGPTSHDADLTHMRFKDDDKIFSMNNRKLAAEEMARAVFHYMKVFLQKNSEFGKPSRESWSKLNKDVEDFVHRDLADKKLHWFLSQEDVVPWESYTTYKCFLQDTSLQDSESAPCVPDREMERFPPEQEVSSTGGPIILGPVPPELVAFSDDFLKEWIIHGNIRSLINASVSTTPVLKSLAHGNEKRLKLGLENPNRFLETVFRMWMVRNHGRVNALGHGLPDKKGFKYLVEEVRKKARFRFESLSQAIFVPGTSNPYLLMSHPPEQRKESDFSILFHFRTAPRDAVMLGAKRIRERWMITSFFWNVL